MILMKKYQFIIYNKKINKKLKNKLLLVLYHKLNHNFKIEKKLEIQVLFNNNKNSFKRYRYNKLSE